MNKKINKTAILIFVLISMIVGSFQSFSQTAEELLPKALQLEEVKGELEEAIKIYQTIVKSFPENRPIAAKAQFHIGLCYEKLGRKEAMKAFKIVLGKFADQYKLAAQARKKIAILTVLPSSKANGITAREVWVDAKDVYDVSPNGRYLSYIDWNAISVNVYDIKGGKSWQITENGTWEGKFKYPDASFFSPDGNQIAYTWYNGDDSEIRIVNLDGSETRVVHTSRINDAFIWPVAWSPNGDYFIAIKQIKTGDIENPKEHKDVIVKVSVKDGTIETLKSLGDQHTNSLSFSQDAQSIVYDLDQKVGDINRDIYYLSTDGRKGAAIVKHPANDWYPFWSTDGKYVIFMSDRTGSKSLWGQRIINGLPSGDPIQLKGNLERRFYPVGRTESGSLYYGTGMNTNDIYSESVDLKTGETITTPTKISKRFEGVNSYPTYSPDGKYLAFLTFREDPIQNYLKNKMVFVIHNIETEVEYDLETELYPGTGWGWFVPRWSHDSKSLLIQACTDEDQKIYKFKNKSLVYAVDIKSGDHTQILDLESSKTELKYPQIDAEGENIFYSSKTRFFYKYNIKDQKHTELFRSDKQIAFTELSPDGKYLAFRYWFDNPNDLWIISTNGGSPVKIGSLQNDDKIDWPCWTPDSRNVVVIGRKSRKLYQFSIDGGTSFEFELSMKGKDRLRIHPNGKNVVYVKTLKGGQQIWAIDNYLPKHEKEKNQ